MSFSCEWIHDTNLSNDFRKEEMLQSVNSVRTKYAEANWLRIEISGYTVRRKNSCQQQFLTLTSVLNSLDYDNTSRKVR
jgi:hypothetical protein